MKLYTKTFSAAGLLFLAVVVPASADYTILQDSSMPSVLYVEFTDIAPQVIIAPSSKDVSGDSAALVDPALPPVDELKKEAQPTLDERIEARIEELENAGETEMPDATVSNEASLDDFVTEEEEVVPLLEGAELR